MEQQLVIARNVARSLNRTTGIPYDILRDSAIEHALRAALCFVPNRPKKKKAELTTYTYSYVRNSLYHELLNNKRQRWAEEEVGHELTTQSSYKPDRLCEFKETMTNFSDDAKTVAEILFSPDCVQLLQDYTNGDLRKGSPKNVRGAMKRYLHSNYGWPWNRIRSAFNEIMEAVK